MKTKNKVIMFIIVVLVVGAGYLAIDVKKEKTVITSGEIIGISDNTVDVLTGDIVNTFEFTSDKLKNHYVGEFVEISGDEKNYNIKHTDYPKEKFDTMGNKIFEITGNVSLVKDKMFVLKSESEEYTFELGDNEKVQEGQTITINYIVLKDSPVILDIINED